MVKFFQATALLLVLAVAACSAEIPRSRNFRRLSKQRHFLARQELDASTPYPSAAELKPEVPFEETAGKQEPDLTYGPPDLTYGPPEVEDVSNVAEQLPTEDEPEEFAPPANDEEFGSEEFTTEAVLSSRLTSRRRGAVQRKPLVSSRLRVAEVQQQKKRVTVLKAQRLTAVPVKQLKTQRLTALPVATVEAAPAPAAVALPLAVAASLQQQQYYFVNQPFAYSAQFQNW